MSDPGPRIGWHEDLECWVVSDLALARQVLSSDDFSAATFDRSFELYMSDEARKDHRELTDFLRLWFVQEDGAAHAALRQPVQRRLSAGYFRRIGPAIEEIVEDALADLRRGRPPEVISTVADPTSARVMALVIGLDDLSPHVMHRWSRSLSAFIGAMYRRDYAERAQRTLTEMAERLAKTPVVAEWSGGGAGADGGADRERALATWTMVLFGGLETTASLIGTAIWYVLSHDDVWRDIRDEAPHAVERAVEAALTVRPPLRNLGRVVAEDIELAGARLAGGDLVLVSLGADELFGGRSPAQPPAGERGVRNLAFGHGPHYCIGAPLARLEAGIVLRGFGRRCADARLTDDVAWSPNLSYVGLDRLSLNLGTPP